MATPLGRGRSMKRFKRAATIGICSQREPKRSSEQAPLLAVCSNKKSNTELNDLPRELLSNILSRLPLTHLRGSASHTCKLWNSIIIDSQFPEIHFSQSLENPGYLYTLSDDSGAYFVDYENTKSRMRLPAVELKRSGDPYFVSCRGLLCYESTDEKHVYVCNPVTGETATIPTPSKRGSVYALGYALLSKRYKYFQCFYERFDDDNKQGEIITLGEDLSMRRLLVPPGINKASSSIAYCNGSVHFSVKEMSGNVGFHRVLSLNMETEKFRTRRVLHSGTSTVPDDHRRIYMTVIGENIAFVVCSENGWLSQRVWMLIDEAKDIWVQKYHFNAPIPGRRLGDEVPVFKLCGLWFDGDLYGQQTRSKMTFFPGGDMVITRVSRYLSYNVGSGKYKVLRLPFDDGEEGNSPWKIVPHVGSLLPLSKLVGGVKGYSSLRAA